MRFGVPAILLASRPHGETAIIARLLTERYGMIAAYVAGGRGRRLRPVAIPGNLVAAEIAAKGDRLPFARLELTASRAPWLGEPLPAAAIGWATALTATVLPERNAYPPVHAALGGLLEAICQAGAARGWIGALLDYEALLRRELGYGGRDREWRHARADEAVAVFARAGEPVRRHLLVDRPVDVMASRVRLAALVDRLN